MKILIETSAVLRLPNIHSKEGNKWLTYLKEADLYQQHVVSSLLFLRQHFGTY